MQLDQWIQKDIPVIQLFSPINLPKAKDNVPYVINGTEGVGKKMFLTHWMKYHKQ